MTTTEKVVSLVVWLKYIKARWFKHGNWEFWNYTVRYIWNLFMKVGWFMHKFVKTAVAATFNHIQCNLHNIVHHTRRKNRMCSHDSNIRDVGYTCVRVQARVCSCVACSVSWQSLHDTSTNRCANHIELILATQITITVSMCGSCSSTLN